MSRANDNLVRDLIEELSVDEDDEVNSIKHGVVPATNTQKIRARALRKGESTEDAFHESGRFNITKKQQ